MKSNRGVSFSTRSTPSEANSHPEVVKAEVHFPTQMVVHDQAILVLLVAKSWLLQVRGTNQQTHHLLQWVLQPRVVEFNASSVEVVVML